MTAAQDVRTVAARTIVAPTTHPDALYVAIIHAAEGVRLATAGVSRADLVRRIAEYVRARCCATLWPSDARYVGALLARRELEAAVEVYFGRVGERWDGEWLVTAAIAPTGEGVDED